MSENPAIRRFENLDAADWVLVVAPIMCNTFNLEEVSGKQFQISSDIGNALAWVTVKAFSSFTNDNPFLRGLSRYKQGDVVISVRAADASLPTVIAYFGY